MRRTRPISEWQKLLQPFVWLFQAILLRLHWWLLLLGIGYLCSNIRIVASDEAALVLRFGQVVDGGSAQAVRPPGLLWALPKPIDEVLVIKNKKIYEIEIDDLHFSNETNQRRALSFLGSGSLDPERVGYLLSGDHNILHLSLVLRYQIRDPQLYLLHLEAPEHLISNAVLRAVLENAGQHSVDTLLTDGRQEFIAASSKLAQEMLNQQRIGVELLSLEVVDLQPPKQVKSDFSAVQSAYIEAQTQKQKAQQYRAGILPKAKAQRESALRKARAEATKLRSQARADAQKFMALAQENRKNSVVLRQRLYREKIDRIFRQAGKLQFVPPPIGGRYGDDFRLTIGGEK